MMKQKKISIIIPVYNASKYFERLLQSLEKQTYKNYEVIFINDGSTDNSLEILKANKKNNFVIIDQSNQGVSAARNKGLDIATGYYITFIDSDDYVDEKYLEALITNLEKNNSDLCVMGYNKIYNNVKKEIVKLDNDTIKIDNLKKQMEFLNNKNGSGICGKIYKRKFVGRFKKISIGEDALFNLEYVKNTEKVTFINECYYNYIYNEMSLTNTLKKDLLKDLNNILKDLNFEDIYIFYTYRIYQEYLLNIYRSNSNLKKYIYEIKNLEHVFSFLKQDVNNIIKNFGFLKKIYFKIINKCLKNNKFALLYIIEKLKLVLKYGKKNNN